MKDYFDHWSLIIILITIVLFVVALFVKGLTKDLLLEVGILLVSVKLIMSAYKKSVYAKKLNKDLILESIGGIQEGTNPRVLKQLLNAYLPESKRQEEE